MALIEALYFTDGSRVAQVELERALQPEHPGATYALCDMGQPSVRTSVVSEDDISFENFSPPVSWNSPYSVHRVRLGPKIKQDYTYHSGEEFFLPIQGQVTYHFFWTPGAHQPQEVFLDPPVGPGTVLRINPQIPHHAWGVGGDATAWVIHRGATDSAAALVIDRPAFSLRLVTPSTTEDQNFSSTMGTPIRLRVTAGDLQKPGAYGLIAWGISEAVREARQKSGFTITELARHLGVDPSSLSRLEDAKANVSIEMLERVANGLRIGIGSCIDTGNWIYERHCFQDSPLKAKNDTQTHANRLLHLEVLKLLVGKREFAATSKGDAATSSTTWIVLKGRVLVQLTEQAIVKSILMDVGNVLHLRTRQVLALQVLEKATIASITYTQH